MNPSDKGAIAGHELLHNCTIQTRPHRTFISFYLSLSLSLSISLFPSHSLPLLLYVPLLPSLSFLTLPHRFIFLLSVSARIKWFTHLQSNWRWEPKHKIQIDVLLAWRSPQIRFVLPCFVLPTPQRPGNIHPGHTSKWWLVPLWRGDVAYPLHGDWNCINIKRIDDSSDSQSPTQTLPCTRMVPVCILNPNP